jgi:hypothetical protein
MKIKVANNPKNKTIRFPTYPMLAERCFEMNNPNIPPDVAEKDSDKAETIENKK